MKKAFVVTAALALLGMSMAAQAVTIPTVPVGDLGNAGELSGYGAGGVGDDRICGSVGYNYNIGKYEVTAGQYTGFLNAVAATDTYGLYNTEMSNTTYGSGITRSGDPGSYTYSVATAFIDRPVNYVSYWDSCRFANWLGNGQGSGGTETGAYTLTPEGMASNTITRNTGWTGWAVTNEDEWYKAAYYKGGSTSAGYWDYPTSSDTAPGRDMADASGNNANYGTGPGPYPIDSGKYTTVAGEFQNSDSPYGTFDQGGNVWEWNEALLYGACRGLRGGAFSTYYSSNLQASYRFDYDYYLYYGFYSPTYESYSVGFRVSEVVPEPSSIMALAGGLVSLLSIRRRRV